MKSKVHKAKKEPAKVGQSSSIFSKQKTFVTKLLASKMGGAFNAECHQIISDVRFLDVYTNPALSEPEDNTGSRVAFVGNCIKAMRAMRPLAEAILKNDPELFKRMAKMLEWKYGANSRKLLNRRVYTALLYYDAQKWGIDNGSRIEPITRQEILDHLEDEGLGIDDGNFSRFWIEIGWPLKHIKPGPKKCRKHRQ